LATTGYDLHRVMVNLCLSRTLAEPVRDPIAPHAGFLLFFGSDGVVRSLPAPAAFPEPWVTRVRLRAAEGSRVHARHHSSDAVARFSFVAPSRSDLLQRANLVRQRFTETLLIEPVSSPVEKSLSPKTN